MWRTLRRSKLVRHALGRTMAGYLWSVHKTLDMRIEPENIYEIAEPEMPVILTFWHGQHFLAPFIMKSHHRAKVLISRHPDADVNAIAAEALGVETIRGSGSTNPKDFHRKNGVGAMREMIATLEQGINIALTADVPKISRVAGLGVVTLARYSGRPIYPIAIATSRRVTAPSWDKASVDLPFGKGGAVAGEPIRVSLSANEQEMEAARKLVQQRLDEVTARAEALAGVLAGRNEKNGDGRG